MADPLGAYHDDPEAGRSTEPKEPPAESSQEVLGNGDERSRLIVNGTGPIKLDEDDAGRPFRFDHDVWFANLRGDDNRRRRTWLLGGLAVFFVLSIFVLGIGRRVPQGFNSAGYRACDEDSEFECGFVAVPRNYHLPTLGKTDIAITRFRATDPRRRLGTLFISAGGPGGSTTELSFLIAKPLSRLLRGQYDIVGFDPRGVGKTKPAMSCFQDAKVHELFKWNNVLSQGFDVPPGDPSLPENRAVITSQIRTWLALSKTQFELCLNATDADDIPFMGTATVARDMDHILTALEGEDALLNYWGPSYGTVIGSYLVNMFPDRIGRVALDGVVNPYVWSHSRAHEWLGSWLNSTEFTYQYLLTQCGTAGPKVCPLSKIDGESAADISQRVDSWLQSLYEMPASYPNQQRPGIITAGMVRALIHHTLTMPMFFPQLAISLAAAMQGDYKSLADLVLLRLEGKTKRAPGDLARSIVACLDAPPYKDQPDTWPTIDQLTDVAVQRLKNVSPRFGMSVSLFEWDGACQYLASAAAKLPERFTGPFNKKLRNPILLASADMDPLTPLTGARWLNAELGDSARLVIQRRTPAHTTFFFGPSMCMAETYRRFYVSGRVPDEKETLCSNEMRLFNTTASQAPSSSEGPDKEFQKTVRDLQLALYDYVSPGLP